MLRKDCLGVGSASQCRPYAASGDEASVSRDNQVPGCDWAPMAQSKTIWRGFVDIAGRTPVLPFELMHLAIGTIVGFRGAR